ncbi:MAG: hypothetical protein HYX74_04295 [Acidobacteria bacterium]|nr:hypothetical protein [Acidobacteriota bacterium]
MRARIKPLLGIIAVAFLFVVLPVEALLQAQEAGPAASLPDGKGKEMVAPLCAGCHALDIVTTKRKSASEWEATVMDMISRGANISSEEAKTIAAYLAEHFSPQSRPAAAGPEGRQAAFVLPDGPGKEVLAGKCYQCHNEGLWKNLRQDRRGWEGTLYRMVGRGALWTEEEISTMAQYLAAAFGPKGNEAPASDRRQK